MAKKKQPLIDVSSDAEPLSSNPFAQLARQVPSDLPEQEDLPAVTETKAKATAPYKVGKTRKGGLPVTFESRGKGKKVTVLRNVSGDVNLLLKKLRKFCGTGGCAQEDSLELQGDQGAKIEAFLSDSSKNG